MKILSDAKSTFLYKGAFNLSTASSRVNCFDKIKLEDALFSYHNRIYKEGSMLEKISSNEIQVFTLVIPPTEIFFQQFNCFSFIVIYEI